jgi:hypothetical protein
VKRYTSLTRRPRLPGPERQLLWEDETNRCAMTSVPIWSQNDPERKSNQWAISPLGCEFVPIRQGLHKGTPTCRRSRYGRELPLASDLHPRLYASLFLRTMRPRPTPALVRATLAYFSLSSISSPTVKHRIGRIGKGTSSPTERGRAGRWVTVVRGLLIGVSDLDELRLAPRSPQQFYAYRQPVRRESARNHNGRQAGDGA